MEYETHPAADAFPMMDANRLNDLIDDIREHGLIEPVIIFEGKILDGRNRYKACLDLGIQPETKQFKGEDPWAFVWSLNGARRDLVDEQRYLIWKYCHENSEYFQAEIKKIQDEANVKRAEAAKLQHEVSNPRKGEVLVVQHSVVIPKDHRKGQKAKAKKAKVNQGAVARGDKLAKDRPDLAKKVRQGTLKPGAAHNQMKKDSVKDRVAEIPDGIFRVLYADPPWSYNDKCDNGAIQSGGAEKHYPSMTLAELEALDIKSISADDSVLFLWATCPLLEDALKVAKAWGFKYKAQFVWDKIKHNMGHYNSVRHELLLICTKGSCTPDKVKLFDSVQSIERTEHSRKPDKFREIIETLYPHGNKLELFRRGDAPKGWKVWGNESCQ